MVTYTNGVPDYVVKEFEEAYPGVGLRSVGGTFIKSQEQGPETPLLENRPIHRSLGRGNPHRGKIYRGKMVRREIPRADSGASDTGRVVGILHFVFNPTSVSFNYEIDPNAAVPYDEQENPGLPLLGPKTMCSFQLVFDRTYETLNGDSELGVLEDVAVLEHILGISTSEEGTISSAFQTVANVYFGNDNAMSFKGMFTGASVEMTHFTPTMVPIRLVMNISMMRTSETDRLGSLHPSSVNLFPGQYKNPNGGHTVN